MSSNPTLSARKILEHTAFPLGKTILAGLDPIELAKPIGIPGGNSQSICQMESTKEREQSQQQQRVVPRADLVRTEQSSDGIDGCRAALDGDYCQ